MSTREQGRGAIAVVGVLVILAGLVAGIVLWLIAAREPNRVAEGFARAAPGCTTTLTFAESGEYYLYEERSGTPPTVAGCEPSATPGQTFTFDLVAVGDGTVRSLDDETVSYDLDAGTATSVARIAIDEPGEYELSVLSDDPTVVAAVGSDPDASVDRLRQGAVAAVAVGLVIGGLLLWMSARRRAATDEGRVDPGWAAASPDPRATSAEPATAAWPPKPPDVRQAVEPRRPAEQRLAPPPPPDAPPEPGPETSPWAPPTVGDGANDTGTDDRGRPDDRDDRSASGGDG